MSTLTTYKFHLDKSSKKFACPGCHKKTFVRYMDSETGEYMSEEIGRCDRENNCGYHYTAKQFFIDNPDKSDNNRETTKRSHFKQPEISKPIEYLPFDLLDKSVSRHDECNLYPFLEKLFRKSIASQLCLDYLIGTNRGGNTVFWQCDVHLKIRQAKAMQYDPVSGRRNKETGAIFIGKKVLNNQDANLQQCFFGEYLLSFPENKEKPVAIVESEKTAVIASIYFPDFIWIATGGKNGARWTERSVCKVLHGRKVVLFPDLGAFESWKNKGLLLAATASCTVAVSDLLEKNATDEDEANGLDIADYLLRVEDSTGLAMTDYNYPVIWDYKK